MRIQLALKGEGVLTDENIEKCVLAIFQQDQDIIKKAAAARGIDPKDLSIYVLNNRRTYTRK
jgi:hypothetical protein